MQKKIWVKPHNKRGRKVRGYYRTINVSRSLKATSKKSVSSKVKDTRFFRNFFNSDSHFITKDVFRDAEGKISVESKVFYKDKIGVYKGGDTTNDGEILKYVWKAPTK